MEIRDKALEALAKSKDLRLLATLGTALLRTDGVPAFSETLNVASQWLETYWSQTYPLVDEDAILRRNALNCFADPMAVVDGLRRVAARQQPAARHVQPARHRHRDAAADAGRRGRRRSTKTRSTPRSRRCRSTSSPQLHDSVAGAVASLRKIDATMRDAAGSEATPSFEPLSAQLARMSQALRAQLALHPDGGGGGRRRGAADAGAGGGVSVGGVVKSRQDAIRALDAVADFFRRTEPSSPIPLFLARAKRLVSKDFLEVLADIAPEAVAQARAAGGLKDESE